MPETPQITLMFVAVFVLMSVALSVFVGLRRAKTGIMLLHGDDEELLKRIRAHGNFVEYVPLALLALAGAEIAGAPHWVLVGSGSVLLAARVLHFAAFRGTATGAGRLLGALLTSIAMVVLSGAILLKSFGIF
ncbi:MAPEG family protein [uncultured Roseobacter sp.]|uniref:MAPEG family protein n=1 Tax=uncultured Roseobacter sp. TaxID=114847 RepID=UPI002619B0FC|nr:MAPEG family protein [uncultured Roseobacter sp.]